MLHREAQRGLRLSSSARIVGNIPPKKQYWAWLMKKGFNPIPVSPYSPKILMKTSASVPAPITSPVYTLISYLLPGNKDRENLS
jgi:hypothetical protein